MPVRVLLVDDVDADRRRLVGALSTERDIDVVGAAFDRASAVDLCSHLQPDAVVVDLGLPDLPRHDLLTQLRDAASAARLIVFTLRSRAADEPEHEMEFDGFTLSDTTIGYLAGLLEESPHGGGRAAELRVDEHADEIANARRFVTEHGDRWGYEVVREEAQLVASELVTNALMHARTSCDLRVRDRDRVLRIEVIDGGREMPRLRTPDDGVEHGRGLFLVSTLCPAWGVDAVEDDGKLVWAELPRS